MKIAVAGTGYVGLSIATLLAQHHHVMAVDVIPEKVEKMQRFLQGRGALMAFFTFLPFVGEAIAVALGFMRSNLLGR